MDTHDAPRPTEVNKRYTYIYHIKRERERERERENAKARHIRLRWSAARPVAAGARGK